MMNNADNPTIPPAQSQAAPTDATSGDKSIERIARAFETGMRRWELIIYPAMFAFVILAAYGFYMVHSLTRDVNKLSIDVARMADAIAPAMTSMSGNMANMDSRLAAMSQDVRQMSANTGVMTVAVHQMGASLWEMNRNISAPMSTFNNMMPWGNSEPNFMAPPPPRMTYVYPQMPQFYPPPAQPAAPQRAPQVAAPQGALEAAPQPSETSSVRPAATH